LDNPDLDWTPPSSLVDWMAKAKEDEKPIVYIGFGSITVPNPHSVTEVIVKAVLKSTCTLVLFMLAGSGNLFGSN
jgi:sterol 3beta-glucosyltransferase